MTQSTTQKIRIQPLADRVLIQRSEAKSQKGGIILPDSAKEKPQEGKVVAAGKGKLDSEGRLEKMTVSQGDTVLFSSYAGTEVKDDEGNEYLLMSENDILAIIE